MISSTRPKVKSPVAVALDHFNADDTEYELSLDKGQTITIRKDLGDGWLLCQNACGQIGKVAAILVGDAEHSVVPQRQLSNRAETHVDDSSLAAHPRHLLHHVPPTSAQRSRNSETCPQRSRPCESVSRDDVDFQSPRKGDSATRASRRHIVSPPPTTCHGQWEVDERETQGHAHNTSYLSSPSSESEIEARQAPKPFRASGTSGYEQHIAHDERARTEIMPRVERVSSQKLQISIPPGHSACPALIKPDKTASAPDRRGSYTARTLATSPSQASISKHQLPKTFPNRSDRNPSTSVQQQNSTLLGVPRNEDSGPVSCGDQHSFYRPSSILSGGVGSFGPAAQELTDSRPLRTSVTTILDSNIPSPDRVEPENGHAKSTHQTLRSGQHNSEATAQQGSRKATHETPQADNRHHLYTANACGHCQCTVEDDCFCAICEASFCDTCWDLQIIHRNRNSDGALLHQRGSRSLALINQECIRSV